MFRVLGIIFIFFGVPHFVLGQDNKTEIKWLTLEEAMDLHQQNPKKILIEIYTDWCKVCRKLDHLSLSQQHIAEYINERYYPVKFDAESRKSVYFQGQRYDYKKVYNSGYHSFAYKITHGQLNYPTLVFFDQDLSVIQSINGFQSPGRLIRILTYFADDYNKKIPWADYNNQYNSIVYPSVNK